MASRPANPQTWQLGDLTVAVERRLSEWAASDVSARMWRRDPTLWPAAPASDVAERMGWLELPTTMPDRVPALREFAAGVRDDGLRSVVLLGMGGSSLAPDVLRAIFGNIGESPELLVLDSTHPDWIASLAERIDPARTLFLVSSKSGTTTEPLSFQRYFWEVVRAVDPAPGPHFAAITDPGTPLETQAQQQEFRAVFEALATVGGRYSALTMFGLVPAALLGIDVTELLGQAKAMATTCGPSAAVRSNPGLALGAILGEAAVQGRDKLTLFASADLAPFGAWVEQLIAESTGKIGKGIVPIVDEPRVAVERYGSDRLFVEIQAPGRPDTDLRDHIDGLSGAGHPVVRIEVASPITLGQEFFRWEVAVASAAMVIGVDPYDQPDVELEKNLAREAIAHPDQTGSTMASTPVPAADPGGLATALNGWAEAVTPGRYVAVQAYLAPNPTTSGLLLDLRRRLVNRWRLATMCGYGPRFLHSTGQLHKGGPNTGLFLQLIDSPRNDVVIPGANYTFGQLIRAQALGDYQALIQDRRRVLRVDLGDDVGGGLARLAGVIDG